MAGKVREVKVMGLSLRELTILIVLTLSTAACGGATSALNFQTSKEVRSTLYRYDGERSGAVWLRRHYRTVVGSAMDPSRAESQLAFHGLRTRFSGHSPDGEVVRFESPPSANHVTTRARIVTAEGLRDVRTLAPTKTKRRGVDPDRIVWESVFPPLNKGEILEFIMEFTIPGTITKDTRTLASPDGDTAQLLLSYYVAEHDTGAFQVVGQEIGGLVTRKDGYDVIALVVNDIKRSDERIPYGRFVTRKTNPRGYKTEFATNWKVASANYKREFGKRSLELRGRNAPPFKVNELSRESIETLYIWTRDRIQRDDALEAKWNSARSLGQVVTNNDLTAVEKVHLLHWLLDASGLAHDVAMARSNDYPRLDADFPSPKSFDTPLIYVTPYSLWLDPACLSCSPGQVRASLIGSRAIVLSGPKEGSVLELPEK